MSNNVKKDDKKLDPKGPWMAVKEGNTKHSCSSHSGYKHRLGYLQVGGVKWLSTDNSWAATMHLEGPCRGHYHHTVRNQTCKREPKASRRPYNSKAYCVVFQNTNSIPLERHFILKNFSMPMSAPNPASVTRYPPSPTSFSPILSAKMEELPWAMLANGPACTNTGVPSRVW